MNINGYRVPVEIRFTTPLRVLRAFAITFGVVFLPVIFALLINGFDLGRLNLGGSAVWFCISVPLSPVLLVKYGRMDIYDNPWIYLIDEKGKKKLYRQKRNPIQKEDIKEFLEVFFTPPLLWVSLVMILLFCTMVYLTAFGFIE